MLHDLGGMSMQQDTRDVSKVPMLEQRVRQLEQRVEDLRLGRRILMGILEAELRARMTRSRQRRPHTRDGTVIALDQHKGRA